MKKLLLAVCLLVSMAHLAVAQCSVCTKVAEGLDNKSARGLNGGIIYLAFLPLAIMGTIGFIWWRHNRAGRV